MNGGLPRLAAKKGTYHGYKVRLRQKRNGNVSIFLDRVRMNAEGLNMDDATAKAKAHIRKLEGINE